eukprot:TRINITY_DN8683_c0_g1_i13.p1 TRINITY_DN8683_c0_g1~~TRINITY_DN8683_c0_g1_i13.p1  ORF type:complete len:172 (-),score=65.66 TRINITY_DN8683_c0_g1_i13:183-698(-)
MDEAETRLLEKLHANRIREEVVKCVGIVDTKEVPLFSETERELMNVINNLKLTTQEIHHFPPLTIPANQVAKEMDERRKQNKLNISQQPKTILEGSKKEWVQTKEEEKSVPDKFLFISQSLKNKFDSGQLDEEDYCEELEQLLVDCLMRKKKMLSHLSLGLNYEKWDGRLQ